MLLPCYWLSLTARGQSSSCNSCIEGLQGGLAVVNREALLNLGLEGRYHRQVALPSGGLLLPLPQVPEERNMAVSL
jgi:hypothetical protein